jgi:hypothetical protein
MNKQSILSILRKIGTIVGLPMILLVFIIVYGEAKNMIITLLILMPIVVLWTRFVVLWMQEREHSDAPEPLMETPFSEHRETPQ